MEALGPQVGRRELRKAPLADALELLLRACDLEPAGPVVLHLVGTRGCACADLPMLAAALAQTGRASASARVTSAGARTAP
jgi:hypothetical protein